MTGLDWILKTRELFMPINEIAFDFTSVRIQF